MYNSGYKSPEENKVKWASLTEAWSPRVSFLISLSIFLHLPMSSILRISLDSAEAGPRQFLEKDLIFGGEICVKGFCLSWKLRHLVDASFMAYAPLLWSGVIIVNVNFQSKFAAFDTWAFIQCYRAAWDEAMLVLFSLSLVNTPAICRASGKCPVMPVALTLNSVPLSPTGP